MNKMKKKSKILTILLLFLPFTLFAQEDEAQKELEEVQKLSQLTQEHYFLHQLAGNWKLSGINYSNNGEIPLKGKAEISKIMKGHYVDFTFSVEHMAGYSDTKMIIGYDSRYSVYSLYIIDDMLNYATISTGVKEDNKLIFTGKNKFIFYDEEIEFRIEIDKVKENKIIYQLFFKLDGQENKMLMYQLIKK